MSELKARVLAYCKVKNIAVSTFEKLAGLGNGYFNAVSKRPSTTKLEGIGRAFTDLDLNWLLTGEGSMLKENMPHVTGDFNTIGGNAINIGNISNSVGASSKQVDALKIENARLQAENKHLQEMVAEKERLITVLMKNA